MVRELGWWAGSAGDGTGFRWRAEQRTIEPEGRGNPTKSPTHPHPSLYAPISAYRKTLSKNTGSRKLRKSRHHVNLAPL